MIIIIKHDYDLIVWYFFKNSYDNNMMIMKNHDYEGYN